MPLMNTHITSSSHISMQTGLLFSNASTICVSEEKYYNELENRSELNSNNRDHSQHEEYLTICKVPPIGNDHSNDVISSWRSQNTKEIIPKRNASDILPHEDDPFATDLLAEVEEESGVFFDAISKQFKKKKTTKKNASTSSNKKQLAVVMEMNGLEMRLENSASGAAPVSIKHVALGYNHIVLMTDGNTEIPNNSLDFHPPMMKKDQRPSSPFSFRLFGLGSNVDGQLSFEKINQSIYPGKEMESVYKAFQQDHDEEVKKEKKNCTKSSTRPSYLSTLNISDIGCTHSFTLFLTSEGKVFSAGKDQMDNRRQNYEVLRLSGTEHVRVEKMSCSHYHVLFLGTCIHTGKRVVMGFGSSKAHQLAQSGEYLRTASEIQVQSSTMDEVVDVRAGTQFSLFLTKKGFLYSCGKNSHQQQGKPKSYVYIMDIMKITTKEFNYNAFKISSICCGTNFSCIVTQNGKAFTTIKPAHTSVGENKEHGFFEVEYFTTNNIHIKKAFATMMGLIFQTSNDTLFFAEVKEVVNNSSSFVKALSMGRPKLILFDKYNVSKKKIFCSPDSDNFLIMNLRSTHMEDFVSNLKSSTSFFSDLSFSW